MTHALLLTKGMETPVIEGPATKDTCVKRAVAYLAASGVLPNSRLDAALNNGIAIGYGYEREIRVVELTPLPEPQPIGGPNSGG